MTVSQGNSAKLWNTMATWLGRSVDRSMPPILTVPEVGRMSPAMMRKSVDLPQPERPSKATISLLRRLRSTSSSTRWPLAPPSP